jgi:site-specific DNA-cytosine methylase
MVDGVPDWLVEAMSDRTKRLSRLGNAVVPQIAEWIGRRIIAAE